MSIGFPKIVQEEFDNLVKNTEYRISNQKQFLRLLSNLNPVEKHLLAQRFCNQQWNGSLIALAILQNAGILSATSYILRQNDNEHVQGIMCEFFEREFELLANFVINSNYDSLNSCKLAAILDEAIDRLITDLEQHPELSSIAYMKAMRDLVPNDVFLKFKILHVNVLLESDECNLRDVFRNFRNWVQDLEGDSPMVKLWKEIATDTDADIELAQQIFKLSQHFDFKGWRFYVICLRSIANGCSAQCVSFVKKHLKHLFTQCAATSSLPLLMHLIITARALCGTKNFESYSQWFKFNIGDMKFVVKVAEFKEIMRILKEIVEYETEDTYLQVHVNTAISAPTLCNEIVLNYKTQCRARLNAIERRVDQGREFDASASILISSEEELDL